MAYGLILIYKGTFCQGKKDFIHLENFMKSQSCKSSIRGDLAKLRYFLLLESKEQYRDDGSARNGYYRITQIGRNFVKGIGKVPAAVYLFNNKSYGFDKKLIDINEALNNKFKYDELMQGIIHPEDPPESNQENLFSN